jgi:predicted TIM-barrel fold metal-dependent hydrolase
MRLARPYGSWQNRPAMCPIIDADTHLMEPLTVYRDHIAPRLRDAAIHVEEDERGWPWLTCKGRRLHFLDDHVPARVELLGERRRRYHAGEPPVPRHPDAADAWNVAERLRTLDRSGVDRAIAFPNLGLLWEDSLRDDLPAMTANLEAQNTWMIERAAEGGGRLCPVAQLTLRDLDWLERELRRVARSGLKLGMIGPHPIGDRALAHPDFDRAWRAFVDNDVTVAFHVAQFQRPLDPAWYALDPEPLNKVMDSVFLHYGPAAAVTNLIIHGTLERFPRLRIGIFELTARWVPEFLMHLDGGYEFYALQNGRHLSDLPMPPSDYFRRQVRVAAFPSERAADLIGVAGDNLYMWCSDYPHAEGMSDPSWLEYESRESRPLGAVEREALAGGNAQFLLGE